MNIFINTYYQSETNNTDPEDNIISPLSKLKLIVKKDDNKYSFRYIDYSELSPIIIYYILSSNKQFDSISLESAFEIIRKFIKVDIANFRKLINILEQHKIIAIDRAAGLNNIINISKLNKIEIIKKLYTEKI